MKLEDHACATGDCAHEKQYECSEAIIDFLKKEIETQEKLLKSAIPWVKKAKTVYSTKAKTYEEIEEWLEEVEKSVKEVNKNKMES